MIPHIIHWVGNTIAFEVPGAERWMTIEEFSKWANETPDSEATDNGREKNA